MTALLFTNKEFIEMEVREVMSEQPASCSPDTELKEVASMMVEHDCGAIPIVENNKPAGIIADRDITCRIVAEGKDPYNLTASTAMTSTLVSVRSADSLEDVERRMQQEKVRRLIVTGEGDEVVGIIAQADLARHAYEEEAGEVVEEMSEPTPEPSNVGEQ